MAKFDDCSPFGDYHDSTRKVSQDCCLAFARPSPAIIRVVKMNTDDVVPLIIRSSLVGLLVPTILVGSGQSNGAIIGYRLALARDILMSLRVAGKKAGADALAKFIEGEDDLYPFEPGTFETISD